MFERKITTISFEGPLVRLMSTRGERVEQWSEVVLPAEAIDNGGLLEPALAGDTIKQRLQADKYPRRHVVVAIPGHRSIIRTIGLPVVEPGLLAGAVERKVRQEITMPPGEMDLAWQVIGRVEDELRIFVAANPRRTIDEHVQALRAAGLKPTQMDIGALALARAANRSNAIIANLDLQGLTVVIVRQGLPVLVRTAPFAGPTASTEARLELLTQELQRTIKFYNDSRRDQPLPDQTPLVATGAELGDALRQRQLSDRMGLPVVLPAPPLAYPDDFPLAAYSVNLGLALKLL